MSIKKHLFSHWNLRFSKKKPSNCQGVDLNLDQFDLSAPERFAANVPSCSAALDSLEVQQCSKTHFWWQDLEGRYFLRIFLVDFCCIWCLELIFFQWKIVLEFAKRFCWNFRQIQDISQEISETVIQFPKHDAEFLEGNGHWRCQKLQTSQARVPLGLAFLQGSRKAAFKAEDQQLFANLYKDELGKDVCVFFSLELNKHEVAKEMFGVSRMFKNRSCKSN